MSDNEEVPQVLTSTRLSESGSIWTVATQQASSKTPHDVDDRLAQQATPKGLLGRLGRLFGKPSKIFRYLRKQSSYGETDGSHENKVYEEDLPDNQQSSAEIARNSSTDQLEAAYDKSSTRSETAHSNPPTDPEQAGAHDGDENKVRGNWGSHFEFILSCIGYAVGLGNVWRFPYLCYKNGGGSFLLIYWILSLTVGFPIIFLELSLGQFTSQGPTGVWHYAPIVKGLGYSMCAISAIGSIYYNVIISWALYYLFMSMRSQLLWTECDFSSWADYRCEMTRSPCSGAFQVKGNDGLCYSFEAWHTAGLAPPQTVSTHCPDSNRTGNVKAVVPCYYIVDQIARNRTSVVGFWDEKLAIENNRGPQFSTEQFFFRHVLGQDGKVDSGFSAVQLGPPQKWLALCLLLAWIIVFLCLLNGIKSSGKVVYFTAIFPYIVLFILIGRGVSLPGAYDGLMYFLIPNFERIKDPSVWYAAASQLFFSLSACWGGMMALSSYNKFHTNVFRDAVIVTAADTLTSFIASFAIFSVIGYGSHMLQKPIEEVADAGTGLAFILYPKIIDSLPGSVAFALLFFFMIILLGLDSEFNGMETIFTALLDNYPQLRSNLKRKALAFGIFCIPFFLLGLPMICPGGTQLLELVDDYGAGWPVLLIGIIETLSVAWIYGTERFAKDLSAMMPWLLKGETRAKVVPWLMRIFWGIITPVMLSFILVYSWAQYEPRRIKGEEALGWCVTIFVIIWVPVFAILILVRSTRRHGELWEGLKRAVKPSRKWGPFLSEHKQEVAAIHGNTMLESSENSSLDNFGDGNRPTMTNGINPATSLNLETASFSSSYHGGVDGGGVVNAGLKASNNSLFSSYSGFSNIQMTTYQDMPYIAPRNRSTTPSKTSIASRSTAV